jgi:hypothetical protein
MAILDWTDAEILKAADTCTKQVDRNSPKKTSSHAKLFEMVEAGAVLLQQNAEYVKFMESLKVEQ